MGRLPTVDAVILDSHAQIDSLPELATELKRRRPALPVVLVTDAVCRHCCYNGLSKEEANLRLSFLSAARPLFFDLGR